MQWMVVTLGLWFSEVKYLLAERTERLLLGRCSTVVVHFHSPDLPSRFSPYGLHWLR